MEKPKCPECKKTDNVYLEDVYEFKDPHQLDRIVCLEIWECVECHESYWQCFDCSRRPYKKFFRLVTKETADRDKTESQQEFDDEMDRASLH